MSVDKKGKKKGCLANNKVSLEGVGGMFWILSLSGA
jgi:hypothetical protein